MSIDHLDVVVNSNEKLYSFQAGSVKTVDHRSSTRGPRAACGPLASFVRPGKGISQNTMRYEY